MRYAIPGKATVLVGGQFGSEGKGAIAAYLGTQDDFDIATTNAGAQAGHTSIVKGKKRIAFHLPTAGLVDGPMSRPAMYLNAGSIIDPDALIKELADMGFAPEDLGDRLEIHPRAAVILPEHKDAEKDGAVRKIASTQKGVGAALAAKIGRSVGAAKDHPLIYSNFNILERNLNTSLYNGSSILVEVPQGFSLSINAAHFYPHCTSRDCTVAQGLSDAGIHPSFLGLSIMVLRTFPIRVGNMPDGSGESGGWYDDQDEISFEELGLPAEYTTVTGRKRRIATFSMDQAKAAIRANRPEIIALTFLNYLTSQHEAVRLVNAIEGIYFALGMAPPKFIYQWGPNNEQISTVMPNSPEIWRK